MAVRFISFRAELKILCGFRKRLSLEKRYRGGVTFPFQEQGVNDGFADVGLTGTAATAN
jgi:hypothetical protein